MTSQKRYKISGVFEFSYGNQKMRVKDYLTEQERHIHAYSYRQAVKVFAIKLEEKLDRKVYIGDSIIEEVEDPKAVKKKKKRKRKQLGLFED